MKATALTLAFAIAALALSSCASKPAYQPAPVDMGVRSGK